ncbi:hypothetical protein FJY71_07800, partial [candidate division WOR-3 bacterium]|nr:hypothetical protein [candidate division WOR-3 bacterium]
LLSRLLASFLVVREGADIEALAQAHAGWNFVTAVGVVRFADGRVVMEGEGRGRLSAERKTRRLNQRLAEVQSAFGGMEASEGSLRQRQVTLEEELGRAEAELAESGRERAGLDATNAAATGVLDDLAAEQARAGAEVHNLEAQLRAAAEKAEPLRQRLAEADSRNASVGRALSAAGMAVAEHEGRVKVALADSAEALAELGEEQQQVSRLEAEQTFAKRTLDDARRKAAGLESGGRQQRQEAAQLRQAADGRASAIEQARQAVEGVEAQAEGLAAAAAAGAEDELERNIAELRHAQERNQRLLMDQRMRRYDLEKQAAAMAEEARASHGTDIGAVAALPGEDFEQRYAAVRRRLEALGAVNPLAAEEFEQERKDLGRLAGQRDDVAQAKVNLEQTMLELDRHAREQFVQTYGEVRLHFQEIFRALFLDGEADLVLVNEASPLESEIAITARPKGKTPKRLEQLSDGEKALLAVSLLFAFYRVKPAPFCFLDEVDAPLDDVNVGRFADYLKGISGLTQVIIITHNRATVERAAALFGVTAEQPGISQLVSVSLAQFSEQRREPEPEN